ncbi:MAG TPA: HAD-IA family hydrolase [Bacillota bacterium]|nr:HAD-IA family hydrolase [Bacillota bacterium]
MIRAVLFDLDGTLLDTGPLILASFRHALGSGLDVERDILPHFGEPLRDTLRRLQPDRVEELVSTYRAFNLEHHDEMVRAFPGAGAALAALRSAGIARAVVTSKMHATAERGLRVCGLDHLVEAVVGLDDVAVVKPDPAPLLRALDELGCTPAEAAMVGDTPADMGAAVAAGCWAIAVGWSTFSGERLREAGALHVLGSFAELPRLVC